MALIKLVSPASVALRVLGGIALFLYALFFLTSPEAKNGRWLLIGVGVVISAWGWMSVKDPKLAIRYFFKRRAVVLEMLGEWKPQPHKLESEYEKDLQDFLNERLPFMKITRQYGAGRIKCDLAVGTDVMIELKAGFKSTQKLQRLIGQVQLYKREWNKPLILVLLGETQKDLLHELHDSTSAQGDLYIITIEAKEMAEPAEP